MASAQLENPPPRLVLNEAFGDMNMLGEAIDWDLDFRQIEAGKLNARVMLLAGARNTAMRVRFDRKFHQRGSPPRGILTFGFPDRRSGPLRWNGSEAMPGALLNFNDGRFEGVNPGNFAGYTLSFTEDLLEEVAGLLGIGLEFPRPVHSIAYWNPRGAEHHRLRQNLRMLERVAVSDGDPGLQHHRETFNFDLAACVVRIMGHDDGSPRREMPPFRAAALKRALMLIDDPDEVPLTVTDLCKAAGASWATLERAFTGEFGIPPKVYIKAKRLAAVRRQLIRAEAGTVIADVANRWGFWHLGRFAADYRKQFGELPSETLQMHG